MKISRRDLKKIINESIYDFEKERRRRRGERSLPAASLANSPGEVIDFPLGTPREREIPPDIQAMIDDFRSSSLTDFGKPETLVDYDGSDDLDDIDDIEINHPAFDFLSDLRKPKNMGDDYTDRNKYDDIFSKYLDSEDDEDYKYIPDMTVVPDEE